MLTLLGLVLAGIWLWSAVHTAPAPRRRSTVPAVSPQTAGSPPNSEEISPTERQQLETILKDKAAGARH